jgi:hypothetical protein
MRRRGCAIRAAPTSRQFSMPRLQLFRSLYTGIERILQVSIALGVTALGGCLAV